MIPLWLLFVLVGAAGGFTAGLFGVGGGLVIVPTLYFLWRGDPVLGPEAMHFAIATSLACIVVTSVTSSWTHWKSQRLAFDQLPWFGLAVSLGSVTAVLLASHVATTWLKTGFGLFALTVCLTLLRQRKPVATAPQLARRELMGAGTLIGHLSTLLGVSGGAMTVPYLVLRGMDIRQAVVVSSAAAIPISLIGALGLAWLGPATSQTVGYVHLPAFLGISAVSMYFANCGARLSQQMDKQKLQWAFAAFLALVAAHMLGF